MNEKKRQILDAAIKCFSQKGYHATSIQDIADTLGIAKGSLYFYFKSKQDLFTSVFSYLIDQMLQNLRSISEDPTLTPHGKLFKQLIQQFEHHMESRDMIKMLMKERFEMNEDFGKLMFAFKGTTLQWYQTCILELYGEEARPYALDAAFIFSAMAREYTMFFVTEHKEAEFPRYAQFFMERLDDLIRGMMAKQQQPLLDPVSLEEFLMNSKFGMRKKQPDVFDVINNIRHSVEGVELTSEKKEEVLSSLLVLEEEFKKPDPRPVIIKGMVAYLRSFKIAEIKQHIAKLAANYE